MKPTNPPPHTTHQDEHLYDDDFVHNEDVAHEHTDVNVRQLLMYTAVLVITCLVSAVIVWGLFEFFEQQAAKNDPSVSPLAIAAGQLPDKREAAQPGGQGPNVTELLERRGVPGPRLLTSEPDALQKLRDIETATLEQYGWIDQKSGVARLPIDEAKKKLLHGGLAVRGDATEDPWIGTLAATRGEASGGRGIPTRTQKSEQRTQNPEGETKKPEEATKAPGRGKH